MVLENVSHASSVTMANPPLAATDSSCCASESFPPERLPSLWASCAVAACNALASVRPAWTSDTAPSSATSPLRSPGDR